MLRTAFVILFLKFSFTGNSQYYFYNDQYKEPRILTEFGFGFGGMNCLTDLGGRKVPGKKFIADVTLTTTKPVYTFFGILHINPALSVRLDGSFGNVTAFDSILKNNPQAVEGRYRRNLSFKSSITEALVTAEFHFLEVLAPRDYALRVSPYVIGGVGAFVFNPQAELNGRWHYLHSLRLEGQGTIEYPNRKQYKLVQIALPVGGGLRYEVSPQMNCRLEVVHRILTTDYLDDVSTNYIDPALFDAYLTTENANLARQLADRQRERFPAHKTNVGDVRGNHKSNDSYFSLQLKVGFMLGRKKLY